MAKTGPVFVRLKKTGDVLRGRCRHCDTIHRRCWVAADTAASPSAMTTVLADRNAEAPLVRDGATKVRMPPVHRLDRIVGGHGHGQRVHERGADG